MKNILTIDVEELFHAEYARNAVNNQDYRINNTLPLLLDLLNDYNVKATFFIVGELAEKYPETIRTIAASGHEIAFHTFDHKPLFKQNQETLGNEIKKFNDLLFLTIGRKCLGFRAPSFSLNKKTSWALRVLEESGMLYDSSIFPSWTPLYGEYNAPTYPYKPSKNDVASIDETSKLWEFPLTVYLLKGLRLPAAGGFYLRFIPSLLWKAVKKMNNHGVPAVIFFHNWEVDSKIQKEKLGLYKSFVTYHNVGDKMFDLVEKLLSDFEFTTFINYMEKSGMIKDHN